MLTHTYTQTPPHVHTHIHTFTHTQYTQKHRDEPHTHGAQKNIRTPAHTYAKLAAARKQAASREILLWMTPSEAPKALQASECSELLDPMRASCWISAQH